jgi:ApeA N-terminal domain 1
MTTAERQQALQRGEVLRGGFWVAGTNMRAAGTLEWSYENGARLRLIGDTHGWPTDFGNFGHVIHGIVEGADDVTLPDAGVLSTTAVGRPTMFSAMTLAWGAHVALDTKWERAVYETANLAGWVADNGLDRHLGPSGLPDGVVMRPPRRRELRLPRAESFLVTEHDAENLGYQSGWSVHAQQRLVVNVRRAARLDDLHDRYAVPLLCFTSFASDRPDCLIKEVVLNPGSTERAEIWRAGPRYEPEPWRPQHGYLFWAEEVPRLSAVFTAWWRLYADSRPALGLFADHIDLGLTYSQPRFLTLYTAMEGYCRSFLGRKDFSLMRDHAAVDVAYHGCSKEGLKLIGASRSYVAHLTQQAVPAPDIIATLPDSSRRAHALMQACLLRDIGFGTRQIERMLQRHHAKWPLPMA